MCVMNVEGQGGGCSISKKNYDCRVGYMNCDKIFRLKGMMPRAEE